MTLFSLAGSLDHASPTAQPESGSEKKMNAIYGPKCLEQYGKFSHVGSWAKMFSALLIGTGDWYSRRCKLTWKLKGTKYNRLYFQLQASTLPTNGTEFGLLHTKILPTPTTMDMLPPKTDKAWEKEMTETRPGRTMPSNLRDVPFRTGLLLTPTTREEVVDLDKFKKRMEKYPNGTTMPNLATQVMGLLKTPCAADAYSENLSKKEQKFGNSGTLAQEIQSGFVEKRWPGLLPTPTMYDYNSARHPELWEKDKKKYADKGINLQCGLKQMNVLGMLPTPRARAAGGNCSNDRGKGNLEDKIAEMNTYQTGTTSQLNPQFVLEMMGFPPNWTELPFLSGETNQSKQGETQSCPK
jgi:hypothetical protein